MPHKFTDSKGRTVNFEARRPIAHPETLAELKQHPELYELYLEKNRIYMALMYRRRTLDPEKKARMLARGMRWRISDAGKTAINRYMRKYRVKNESFRIAGVIRSRIYRGVFLGGGIKKAENHLGCSIENYKAFLESKWLEGMSWENFGNRLGKWCIDHIRPIAFYDLTDPEQLKACFVFTNTQPIWFRENAEKWYVDKATSYERSPSLPSPSALSLT